MIMVHIIAFLSIKTVLFLRKFDVMIAFMGMYLANQIEISNYKSYFSTQIEDNLTTFFPIIMIFLRKRISQSPYNSMSLIKPVEMSMSLFFNPFDNQNFT